MRGKIDASLLRHSPEVRIDEAGRTVIKVPGYSGLVDLTISGRPRGGLVVSRGRTGYYVTQLSSGVVVSPRHRWSAARAAGCMRGLLALRADWTVPVCDDGPEKSEEMARRIRALVPSEERLTVDKYRGRLQKILSSKEWRGAEVTGPEECVFSPPGEGWDPKGFRGTRLAWTLRKGTTVARIFAAD